MMMLWVKAAWWRVLSRTMFRKGILMLSPFGTYRNVPAVKKALFRAANLSSSGGIALVKWSSATNLFLLSSCGSEKDAETSLIMLSVGLARDLPMASMPYRLLGLLEGLGLFGV